MHIWIPKINPQKRREVEKVIEHVVETASRAVEKERISVSPSRSETGYMDEKKLNEIVSKARNDKFGKVEIVRGEGGQVYLKAGDQVAELRRQKFMVANLLTGEKRRI